MGGEGIPTDYRRMHAFLSSYRFIVIVCQSPFCYVTINTITWRSRVDHKSRDPDMEHDG
jgi:ABC-type transport system involved in Fe-S cluster assembly fused permease/ATPase subunit